MWKNPEKRHKLSDGNSAVNTTAYVLSDFEESVMIKMMLRKQKYGMKQSS